MDGLVLKKRLLSQILQELEREKNTLVQAALIAREAATHEESKAEDKYDTRGLEASYLAGAQAKRAAELEKLLFDLSRLELNDYKVTQSIGATSLVRLLQDEKKESRVFLIPFAGGIVLEEANQKIQVITPSSPLGQELIGRTEGDDFELKLGSQNHSYEILECL